MRKQYYPTFLEWYEGLSLTPFARLGTKSLFAFGGGVKIPVEERRKFEAFDLEWDKRWETKLRFGEIEEPGWYCVPYSVWQREMIVEPDCLVSVSWISDTMSAWSVEWAQMHPEVAENPLMVVRVSRNQKLWIEMATPPMTGKKLRVVYESGRWFLEEIGGFFKMPLPGFGSVPFLRALLTLENMTLWYPEDTPVVCQWMWAAGQEDVLEDAAEAANIVNNFFGKKKGITVSQARKAARKALNLAMTVKEK